MPSLQRSLDSELPVLPVVIAAAPDDVADLLDAVAARTPSSSPAPT